jgi:hypothetical protein
VRCQRPRRVFPTTASAVLPGTAFNHATNTANFNQGSAFVSVFNAAGASLLYSSLYGGFGSTEAGSDGQPGNNGQTYGAGVAVDASGNFYPAGTSSSNQLPVTPCALQRYSGNRLARGFVAKFSPVSSKGGASLIYATYLGGTEGTNDNSDQIGGIAADAAGNAYVTGNTQFYDFPVTVNTPSFCTATTGCQNTGFLTKINPSGSGLVWSTLVGATTSCRREPGSDIRYRTALPAARFPFRPASTVPRRAPAFSGRPGCRFTRQHLCRGL